MTPGGSDMPLNAVAADSSATLIGTLVSIDKLCTLRDCY